jgi:hypothetical protein
VQRKSQWCQLFRRAIAPALTNSLAHEGHQHLRVSQSILPQPGAQRLMTISPRFPHAAATNPLSGPFSLYVFVSGRLGFPTHRYNRGVCGSLIYTPRSEFVRISEILALIRGARDAPMVEVRVARRVQPISRQRGCGSLAQWPHWSERMTRKTHQWPR